MVTPLADGSNRTVVIQLGNPDNYPVFIIHTYMPTEGAPSKYENMLDEVHEIVMKYQQKKLLVFQCWPHLFP